MFGCPVPICVADPVSPCIAVNAAFDLALNLGGKVIATLRKVQTTTGAMTNGVCRCPGIPARPGATCHVFSSDLGVERAQPSVFPVQGFGSPVPPKPLMNRAQGRGIFPVIGFGMDKDRPTVQVRNRDIFCGFVSLDQLHIESFLCDRIIVSHMPRSECKETVNSVYRIEKVTDLNKVAAQLKGTTFGKEKKAVELLVPKSGPAPGTVSPTITEDEVDTANALFDKLFPELEGLVGSSGERGEKGGPGSGNWGHFGRISLRGGSAPKGGLTAIGSGMSSTPEERRAQAERYRQVRDNPPDMRYEEFGNVQDAERWLSENKRWMGRVANLDTLTDEEKIVAVSTFRQINDATAQTSFLSDSGRSNSFIAFYPEQENSGYQAMTVLSRIEGEGPSRIAGPIITVGKMETRMLDVERAREDLKNAGGPLPKGKQAKQYQEILRERCQERVAFLETGKYQDQIPHSLYTASKKDQIRISILHEYGHHMGALRQGKSIITGTSLAQRLGIEDAKGNWGDWRKKFGATSRAKDDWAECIAENFTLFMTGQHHLMNPEMVQEMYQWTRAGVGD